MGWMEGFRTYTFSGLETYAKKSVGGWGNRGESVNLGFMIFFFHLKLGGKIHQTIARWCIFHFHPYLGKIPILTNIFQMG